MTERIFKISEIPMRRPVVLSKALRYVDTEALAKCLNGSASPRALRAVVDRAVATGAVRSVQAEVPTKGRRRFVDLERFADEMRAFVERGGGKGTAGAAERLDDDTDERSLRRSLVRRVARSTPLRRVTERLCFRTSHLVELALSTPFAPLQIPEEITALLGIVARLRPKSVLEVGSSRGGTLYLFTKFVDPSATLMSVDLRIPDPDLLRSFARGRQRVVPFQGDSGAASTLEAVRKVFPEPIDYLFLDGDHSYEGVRRDFETYGPLVRPGGVVAFHDIVEDNETRYGVITGGWSGGVPQFWREVREGYEHAEFVQSHHQDACGIGVLYMGEGPRGR
jgi:cephalosporin hydroxylase